MTNTSAPDHKPDSEQEPKAPSYQKSPSFLQVIGSVFAMWFGVQSGKNRDRDFGHGSASTFIVMGVVFTLFLVIAVIIAVKLALSGTAN